MLPVSATVSPAARFSIVTARTGRISGASFSSARWQADSSGNVASAAQNDRARQRGRSQEWGFAKHGMLRRRLWRIFFDA